MWSLRALNGNIAGQVFNLKSGKNVVGRGADCDVVITSAGISKKHCEIHVYTDKLIIADLRSSNGTFLNGVKIQNSVVRMGDKIQIHDIIFDLTPVQDKRPAQPVGSHRSSLPLQQGNAALKVQQYATQLAAQQPQLHVAGASPQKTPQHLQHRNPVESVLAHSQDFVERVALPGVYKLGEWFEFRLVIALFVVTFVFAVTILAMIPTFRSAKESVMGESLRRALSVARHLAEINQKALLEGQIGSLSTHSAELEEGVKDVFIVQKSDGAILAPASKAGRIADESFVHKARTEDRSMTAEIGPTTLGASAPIGQFDPGTGLPSVKAYAIVIYDVSGMALDESRALSLFMQILVLAGLIGSILFYLLVKFVEKPMKELNFHLDVAMRERKENITIPYLYPDLQAFLGNLNSLLTRNAQIESSGVEKVTQASNKVQEAQALMEVCVGPAMIIGADDMVWGMNEPFQRLVGFNSTGESYKKIPDSPLQQNIEALIAQARENPYSPYSYSLEFSGRMCQLQLLSIHTNAHTDYFLVTVKPQGGDG